MELLVVKDISVKNRSATSCSEPCFFSLDSGDKNGVAQANIHKMYI